LKTTVEGIEPRAQQAVVALARSDGLIEICRGLLGLSPGVGEPLAAAGVYLGAG